MGKLVSQAKFARRIKKSEGRVSQYVKEGIIILVNGKVDPEQAIPAIKASIDLSRQAKSEAARKKKSQSNSENQQSLQLNLIPNGNGNGKGSELSLTEARRNNELLRGELLSLKLQVERGQLVPRDTAIKWLTDGVADAKDAFLALPRRIAGILAPIIDEKETEFKLSIYIREILEQLSKPLEERSQNASHQHSSS